MSADAGVTLTASMIASHLRNQPPPESVEALVRAAMSCAKTDDFSWMLTTDDDRFKAGIGAVVMFYKDDPNVQARITHEVKLLRALAAATSGIPVDLGAVFSESVELEPVGLMKCFREAK